MLNTMSLNRRAWNESKWFARMLLICFVPSVLVARYGVRWMTGNGFDWPVSLLLTGVVYAYMVLGALPLAFFSAKDRLRRSDERAALLERIPVEYRGTVKRIASL